MAFLLFKWLPVFELDLYAADLNCKQNRNGKLIFEFVIDIDNI